MSLTAPHHILVDEISFSGWSISMLDEEATSTILTLVIKCHGWASIPHLPCALNFLFLLTYSYLVIVDVVCGRLSTAFSQRQCK